MAILRARRVDALQNANFEPWLDTERLSGGDLWDERIRDEIEDADFTLVLYSPALCRKTDSYVNKEIAPGTRTGAQGPRLLL